MDSHPFGISEKDFFDGSMEIYFSNIRVSQINACRPIVFEGPGKVFLRKEGLRYELYHKSVGDEFIRHMSESFSGRAGELESEGVIYEFEGRDTDGRLWVTQEADTEGGRYSQNFSIVEGNLNSLSASRAVKIDASSIYLKFRKNSWFPENRIADKDIQFNCGNVTNRLAKCELYDLVELSGPSISPCYVEALHKSLNVISGAVFSLALSYVREEELLTMHIYSSRLNADKEQFPVPLDVFYDPESKAIESLYNVIHPFFEQQGERFYDEWYRLTRAWQGGIEPTALHVCVGIEGVMRAYFEEQGTDKEFYSAAVAIIPSIEGMNIDDRIKNCLLASIKNTAHFSAKSALAVLARKGAVSSDLPKAWSKLRGKKAHAAAQGVSREDIQKLADLMFKNIKLFYEIFFELACYSGMRTDYGTHGFPLLAYPNQTEKDE